MKIIIGLGNPGEKYERTRHNLGFRVIDFLAEQNNIGLAKSRYHRSYTGKGNIGDEKVMLVKPATYMNLSGEAVQRLFADTGEALENFLIICDDFQLPHGAMRMRRQGSSGGHNGLESIIQLLGDEKFPRLRIGLGAPVGVEHKRFVLSNFTRAEEKQNKEVIETVAQAVDCWVKDGIEKAMTSFNK
ncbi:MAG: aminoacyl-tRNA hydrolase [Candidatus Brocadiia bacterium]